MKCLARVGGAWVGCWDVLGPVRDRPRGRPSRPLTIGNYTIVSKAPVPGTKLVEEKVNTNHKANNLIRHILLPLLLFFAVAAVTACSGDESRGSGGDGGSTVGSAGGTVSGPDGVQLIVPPGALDADVTISIARSAAGAPSLPPGLGNAVVYEITPHGLQFAAPVQIRIPYTGTVDADATTFFAEPGGEWTTMPASFANGIATIERTSLSWYFHYQAGVACVRPAPDPDPYSCIWASISPGQVTTTPSGAISYGTGSYGMDLVTQAATLNMPLQFRAARDCVRDAQVTINRQHSVPSVSLSYQRILQQSVSMATSPTDSSLSEGSLTFQPQVSSADNGYLRYDIHFSCRRLYDNESSGTFLQGSYQVAIGAPAAPTITQQPANQSVTEGQTSTFSVTATGSTSIVWQRSNDGGTTWTNIGTGLSYTTPALALSDNNAQFRAHVCNGPLCVDSNAATLTVTAAATHYTVGGTVSGLSGTGLVLQNNGGDNLAISGDGTFAFATPLASGAGYAATILTQPSGQSCVVTNGTGTISGANVTNVAVACANIGPSNFTVGGTVSGLSGALVLQNNGSDNLAISNDGVFTFATPLANGSGYAATVLTQPSGQNCVVTNGTGIISGANVTNIAVTCSATNTVTDIDGNVYNTVTIGTQVWMQENLKVTKYRNGDAIGTTTPATLNISGETSPKYQWAYDGNESNVATYGRLYTWYAATDSRGLCPTGWHLPTDAEWTTFTDYLGGETVAGGKMKEAGTAHWASPNTGADNSSGFTARPGGNRWHSGTFYYIGVSGYWWSATESDATLAWYRYLEFNNGSAWRASNYKDLGFSVRCVKD